MHGSTGAMLVAVVAAATAAAGQQQLLPVAGEPGCNCSAVCTAFGDPHVTDFAGATWLESSHGWFLLYAVDGFNVTAEAQGNATSPGGEFITSVTFGEREIWASGCTSPLQTFSDHVDLGVYGHIFFTARCDWSAGAYHLDVTLSKTVYGPKADFASIEQDMGSSGVCTSGPENGGASARRLRGRRLQTPGGPVCTCSSTCSVKGDPHVEDFYGGTKTVSNKGSITIYAEGDFEVTGTVSNKRVKTLDVNGTRYEASSACQQNKQTIQLAEQSWASGDTMSILLECKETDHSGGMFFNSYVTKVDAGAANGATFASLQAERGASGRCESSG